jgi:hypothetical protein
MQLSLSAQLSQFTNILQDELFPSLSEKVGALSSRSALFVAACSMVPLRRFVPSGRYVGRPSKDRLPITRAFLAKSIYNFSTTRQLLDHLRVDTQLLQLCGWRSARSLPHESTFSRAFAEFAESELPQLAHQALVEATQRTRLIGHISRDSTAIEARERFPDPPAQRQREPGKKKKRPRRATVRQRQAAGTRLERQCAGQALDAMLAELPTDCSIGVKTSSKGHQQYWRGYKLHLDVADGQIPITALITGASLHDSQAAIPMMRQTSQRVTYLYDLMDSAYDASSIRECSRRLNHVPLIDFKTRAAAKTQLPCRIKPQPEFSPPEKMRYRERTSVERVFARLKDEFGATHIRVRGARKVMAHLMFGVLALTVDQTLRLAQ